MPAKQSTPLTVFQLIEPPRSRCSYPCVVIHLARVRWLSHARRARCGSRVGSIWSTMRATPLQSAPSLSASSNRKYVTKCSSSYSVNVVASGAMSATGGSNGGVRMGIVWQLMTTEKRRRRCNRHRRQPDIWFAYRNPRYACCRFWFSIHSSGGTASANRASLLRHSCS